MLLVEHGSAEDIGNFVMVTLEIWQVRDKFIFLRYFFFFFIKSKEPWIQTECMWGSFQICNPKIIAPSGAQQSQSCEDQNKCGCSSSQRSYLFYCGCCWEGCYLCDMICMVNSCCVGGLLSISTSGRSWMDIGNLCSYDCAGYRRCGTSCAQCHCSGQDRGFFSYNLALNQYLSPIFS